MLSGTWNRETVLGSIPAIYIYNIMITIYCHLIIYVYFFNSSYSISEIPQIPSIY